MVLLCRAPRTERQGWRFAAECGLIVLGMLLFSERTWKHHAVTLLIPAAALAYAATLDLPRRLRGFVVGSLVASGLLMTLPGLFGSRGRTWPWSTARTRGLPPADGGDVPGPAARLAMSRRKHSHSDTLTIAVLSPRGSLSAPLPDSADRLDWRGSGSHRGA